MEKSEKTPILDRKLNSINGIIDSRGFGSFQITIFLCLAIIKFADGAQVTIVVLLQSILIDIWDLSSSQVAVFGGAVLWGMAIGLILSVSIEHHLGRSNLIKLALVLMLIFGTSTIFMPGIWSLSLTRMCVGVSVGLALPNLSVIGAQLAPSNVRGKFFLGFGITYMLGQAYVMILGLVLTPEPETANWRLLLALTVLPVVPAIILVFLFMIESPLYLARTQQYEKAVLNLERIALINKAPGLTQEQKAAVRSEIPASKDSAWKKMKGLFQRENRVTTYKMICLWMIGIGNMYGLMLNLPFLVEDFVSHQGLIYVMISITIGEIFTDICLFFMIERSGFGRKNTFRVLFFILGLISVACGFIQNHYITIISVVLLISLTHGSLVIIYAFTAQVHSTELRLASYVTSNIFARLASSILVYLYMILVETSFCGYFCYVGAFYVIGGVVISTFREDTQGITLDTYKDH